MTPLLDDATAAGLAADDIALIRFLWVDHGSITRGKAVSLQRLGPRLRSGIGLAKTRQACGLSDVAQPVAGFNAVGEVRLAPAPETLIRLPHAPGSAAVLCDLVMPDGAPWDACPRTFLKQALACAAEYSVVAGFEPEFTLCRAKPVPGLLEPVDDSLCFDNEGFDATSEFSVDLVRALESQGLGVETCHPEFGAGQYELTLLPAPALRAADAYVQQRMITRGLARRHGMWATFAPVPAPRHRGNGNHLHLSLWTRPENGEQPVNLFAAPDNQGISDLGRSFIAGLLDHLPALTALACASVNSYHRLRPRMWSGAFAAYGFENREAAIRVPNPLCGMEAASANIEFRPCDSTANPYLVLGAVVHAGMDGIRRGLDPGDPLMEDPNEMTEAELTRAGVGALPASLEAAIEALEADEMLMSALGPLRRQLYPAIKQADVLDRKDAGEDADFYEYAVRF
jgi:glutamine synthetase